MSYARLTRVLSVFRASCASYARSARLGRVLRVFRAFCASYARSARLTRVLRVLRAFFASWAAQARRFDTLEDHMQWAPAQSDVDAAYPTIVVEDF